MNIIQKAIARMVFPSHFASLLHMPRTGFDYAREVNGRQSAIIMACVNWIARTFPEAPLYLRQRKPDGSWDNLYDHPMLSLLDAPNPFYDGLLLQQATIADFTIDGNAYWRKIRSGAKRVVQLWWIPSAIIEPKWDWRNTEYITHYDYSPGGTIEPVPVEDIVHFRNGLDPNNMRKGLAPLKSLFREVFTDDEAANMTAALLRNLGVPGVVISPKEGESMGDEAASDIKEWFKEMFTRDKRGEPLVMSSSTEVEQFGFSPQQMNLKDLRRVPEERISGVLGVPAIVAGLGAGLDRSTYANMAEAREMGYESNIIPTQRIFGSVVKRQLLNEFEDDITLWQVAYEITDVRVLQEDKDKRDTRIKGMVKDGMVAVDDGQRLTGMPVDTTQHLYLRPLQVIEVPAGTKSSTRIATKALTEEQKAILWKLVDRRRQRWWGQVSEKVELLYGDEMGGIIKAIKGKKPAELVDAAGGAIDGLSPEWEKMLTAISASLIEDFGKETAENLGAEKAKSVQLKWVFDPTSVAIRKWIEVNGAKSVKTILATNLEDVKRIILAGIDENLSTVQIGRNLRQFYSGSQTASKAMRVARTEVCKASSFGQIECARQSGVVKKKIWVTSGDDRVRPEHEAMDGETVVLEGVFSNGLEYPSEPNCRCTLGFVTR